MSISTSFRVWGLNVFGLNQDLSCGLGLLPVDRLSSFVPFGLRLILQRLIEGPKSVGERSNFKIFLRTRKIMVMHSNERGECDLRTLVDRQ